MTSTSTELRPTRSNLLWQLAVLNVIVHVAGLAFMASGIRQGSALVALAERMAYVAGRPWGWTFGWGTWMLCALALIAFLAAVANMLRYSSQFDRVRMAVTLSIAGGAIDLLCDVTYITVMPLVAAGGRSAERLYLAVERLAGAGGLIVANGFYTVAILLVTLALRSASPQARGAVVLGLGVFGFGALMVVAGFSGSPWFAAVVSVPTMILYCLWVVAVARALAVEPQGGRS